MIILFIIFSEYYVFIFCHLPRRKNNPFSYYLQFVLFHFFLSLLLPSYYKVVSTDPGFVQETWRETQLSERLENGSEEDVINMCGKCDKIRPARAHHCSICRKCVMKFDHVSKRNRCITCVSENEWIYIIALSMGG